MANFDTAAKRYSGMGLGLADPPLLPIPDGTIAQGDRQHFLDMYSGILATSGVAFKAWLAANRNSVLGAGGLP